VLDEKSDANALSFGKVLLTTFCELLITLIGPQSVQRSSIVWKMES